jgi:hypothetical protein
MHSFYRCKIVSNLCDFLKLHFNVTDTGIVNDKIAQEKIFDLS